MSGTLLIIAAAVIGVLLTTAGVVGVWLAMRTAEHTQTVRNFREASASWREKAESQAADLAAVQAEMTTLKSKYDELRRDYEALKRVVTGTSAMEALGVTLEQAKSDIILEIKINRETLQGLVGMGGVHGTPA